MHRLIVPFLNFLYESKIDVPKAMILCAMAEKNGQPFSHYNAVLGFHTRTSINRLVALGFVHLKPPNYWLTEKGKAATVAMLNLYADNLVQMCKKWTPEAEPETRFHLSMQFVQNLERAIERGTVIARSEDRVITNLEEAVSAILGGTFTMEGVL